MVDPYKIAVFLVKTDRTCSTTYDSPWEIWSCLTLEDALMTSRFSWQQRGALSLRDHNISVSSFGEILSTFSRMTCMLLTREQTNASQTLMYIQSPRDYVNMQSLTQWVWGRVCKSEFLTSSQVMPMLLV